MSLSVMTQGGAGGETASIFVTGLEENSTVTATKDGKTVNGEWAPRPIYRDGFTVLEYIKSTGEQYIDALLQTTSSLRFWVDFSIENEISASDIGTVFGMRSSGIWEEAYDYALNTYPNFSGGTFQVGHVSVPAENVSADPKIVPNQRCQISYLGNTFTATDGTTTELAPQSFNALYTLFLFAKHIVNDVGEFGKVTLYRAKFYDGSALVRDFVPMKRNADGVVGLYDVVNDVFYTDGRNGAFIAGLESTQYSYCHKITIKEYGMWTVTASNGEETITQDVLVDAAVDYEIEMSYRFYLYREGDECVGVTGGWVFPTTHTTQQTANNGSGALWVYDTNSGGGSVTKQKNADSILLSIYCPAGSIASATAEIQKQIDFTNYTKMCVKVSEAVNGGPMLCARTRHKWSGAALRMWNGDDSDIVFYTGGYESNGVYSVDISGVSGMMNVAVLIGGYFGETTSMSARFTEVWLEK